MPAPRSLSSAALLFLLTGCAGVTPPAQAAGAPPGPATSSASTPAGISSAMAGPPSGPAADNPTAPAGTPSESPADNPSPPAGAPSAAGQNLPAWVELPAYTYVLTAGCTRGFSGARYRVTVKDHAVVAAVPLDQQAAAHPDYAVPTLAGLARWAAEAQAQGSRIRYDRDPADGRPVAVGFDPDAMAVDAGECFTVSGYRPS